MFKRLLLILLVTILAAGLCSCTGVYEKQVTTDKDIKTSELEDIRKEFDTNLIYKEPSPQSYSQDTPPSGVSEIEYDSGDLRLKAWISNAPEDNKKHPAIVYVHGGFAFGLTDWEYMEPYLDEGFVVMTPMLRGENGNPGCFEFFYGEVDDAIAAGQYLKSLSYVDPDGIFLSGHSNGGTIAMLASMISSPFKAVATFGASPDQKIFFDDWQEYVPFDITDPTETDVRNPVKFIHCIQKPLYIYAAEGDVAYYIKSKEMAEDAIGFGKECEFVSMKGDHFSSLSSCIEDSIKRLLE